MKFCAGIVQGRLTSAVNGQLQFFPQDSWQNEYTIAREEGLQYIELIAERNHNPNNPIWSESGIKEIQSLLNENSLDAYSFCNDYVIDHSILEKKVIEQNFSLIDKGAQIGFSIYILPLFEASELALENQEFDLAVLKIANYCDQHKIKLCLETSVPALALIGFLERIQHPNVGLVFDCGNRAALGHDLRQDISLLSDYIKHVHIKDKNVQGENVILGTGRVNFLDVFLGLKKINYQGRYTFETTRAKDPIQTLRFNKNFIDFFYSESFIR